MDIKKNQPIKIIVGLGNPGKKYHLTRHNIGFLVVDSLVDKYNGVWQTKGMAEVAEIICNNEKIIVIKPQTFMNSSGKVLPAYLKQGLNAANIVVIHDELEKAFGTIGVKVGGSHRGHNGLRSIIELCGAEFMRIRCGIGRPDNKEDVADYVLAQFSEPTTSVELMINNAVNECDKIITDCT